MTAPTRGSLTDPNGASPRPFFSVDPLRPGRYSDRVYSTFLILHSLLRYAVVVLAVVAVVAAWQGFVGGKAVAPLHKRVNLAFLIAVDLQLLLGLALYLFFSPVVKAAMADMGAAMKTRGLRFWAVEHTFLMLLAVVMVHIGYATWKRGSDDKTRHKRAAIFFTIAVVLIAAGIPWPFLQEIGRPWLPF